MPGKKGSRVAASQARAKANARKKARSAGPDLSSATREAPSESLAEDTELGDTTEESSFAVAKEHTPLLTIPAARPSARRAASRRERQAFSAISAGGNLKREVATIGTIAALSGVALAIVKLATDLGR